MDLPVQNHHFNQVRAEGIRKVFIGWDFLGHENIRGFPFGDGSISSANAHEVGRIDGGSIDSLLRHCLLYTSPSPRDGLLSRMPSSA